MKVYTDLMSLDGDDDSEEDAGRHGNVEHTLGHRQHAGQQLRLGSMLAIRLFQYSCCNILV